MAVLAIVFLTLSVARGHRVIGKRAFNFTGKRERATDAGVLQSEFSLTKSENNQLLGRRSTRHRFFFIFTLDTTKSQISSFWLRRRVKGPKTALTLLALRAYSLAEYICTIAEEFSRARNFISYTFQVYLVISYHQVEDTTLTTAAAYKSIYIFHEI